MTFKPGSGVRQGTPHRSTARDRCAQRHRAAGRRRRRRRGVQRRAERVGRESRQLRDRELRRRILGQQPRVRDRADRHTNGRLAVSPWLARLDRGLRHRPAAGRRRRDHVEPVARRSHRERQAADRGDHDGRAGLRAEPRRQLDLGNGTDGKPVVASATGAGALANSHDLPTIPSVGGAIFAPLGGDAPGTSLIAPATSLGKAIDAALPAEQARNDNQLDAWNARTGKLDDAFPQVVGDLEFLAQPIAADVGAHSTPYIVSGTGTYDLRAIDAAGAEAPRVPEVHGRVGRDAPRSGRSERARRRCSRLGLARGSCSPGRRRGPRARPRARGRASTTTCGTRRLERNSPSRPPVPRCTTG